MKPFRLIVVCLAVFFAVGCGGEKNHDMYGGYSGGSTLSHLAEVADGAKVNDVFPYGLDIDVQWIYPRPENSTSLYEYNLDDVSWYSSDSIPEPYTNMERVIGFIEFNKPLDSIEITRSANAHNMQYKKYHIYINAREFCMFAFIDKDGTLPEHGYDILFVDIDGNKTRYVMMYNELYDQDLGFLDYLPLKAFAGAMIVAGKAR